MLPVPGGLLLRDQGQQVIGAVGASGEASRHAVLAIDGDLDVEQRGKNDNAIPTPSSRAMDSTFPGWSAGLRREDL